MIMNVVFTNFMLIFIFLWPDNMTSYLLLNICNFIANIFCFVQQASVVNYFSVYPTSCISSFFLGTGISNLLYFGLRELLLAFDLQKSTQVWTIYGFSTFCLIIGVMLHGFMMKTEYYKFIYPYLQKPTQITWTQYKDALLLIKKEFWLVFFSVGLDFIPYPGVIFSIQPKSIFSDAQWNTIVSLSLGIADTFGKWLGNISGRYKCIVHGTFGLQIVVNVLVIIYYFTNLWQQKDWEYFSIIIFVVIT